MVRGWKLLTVHEGTASLGKARERDSELDAFAIGSGGALDGASESGPRLLGKSTNVRGAGRVAGDLGSGSDGRGLSSDGCGGSQDGDDGEKHLRSRLLNPNVKNGVEIELRGLFSDCRCLRVE